MTVRARLLLTLVAITVILLLPALYGLDRLNELREIASEQRGQQATAWIALGRVRTALSELEQYQRSYVAAPNPSSRASMGRALDRAATEHEVLVEAGYTDEESASATQIAALRSGTEHIESLVESGQALEATRYLQGVKPLVTGTRIALERIARRLDEESASTGQRARAISEAATINTLIALIGCGLIALLLGIWVTDAVTRPVRRLQSAMSSVSEGSVEAPADLPYSRGDELGDLSRSFRSMTEQLAELNRLKAEFMSVMSHKLKTPLHIITGYSDLIEEELYFDLTKDQREALQAMRGQVEVLQDRVSQLLDLSRMEAGDIQLMLDPINLEDFCNSLRRSYQPVARRKEIDFTVELSPSAPETIIGDEDRLRSEVIGNFLGNAFKFTYSGGVIGLRFRGSDEFLEIQVTDTGIGIPDEDLPHIFDKYYQAGSGARSMGAGLGLAIAREVVEAHGGEISVESRRERGTSFRVRLPVRPTEAPVADATEGRIFAEDSPEPSTQPIE